MAHPEPKATPPRRTYGALPPSRGISDAHLRAFLDDDLDNPPRDRTTDAIADLLPPTSEATLVARDGAIASGVDLAARVFGLCDVHATPLVKNGDAVAAGAPLVRVAGPTVGILRAERTALNIVGRMMGITTLTERMQRIASGASATCRVAATRKTTPGFRAFEKLAVAHGGGDPHRYGLFDHALVKDNHRAAAGDLATLVRKVQHHNADALVEVEVETLDDALVVARLGVDWILVDNQPPEMVQQIAAQVRQIAPQIRIEASGGITSANVAAYAPHVERVSMGALTQAACAVDVSLEWARR